MRPPWAGLLLLIFAACAAHAHQAVVLAQDSPTTHETGQAFLSNRAGQCYAISPAHVLQQGQRQGLRREGRLPLFGELGPMADLGEDVGIAPVTGIPVGECGLNPFAMTRAVDAHLRANALGVLRSVNADGTFAQMAVAIVDNDGDRLLRVQPTHATTQIRKGLSGSQLVIGDAVIGMLVSVHARSGVGTVVRQDAVLSRVDAWLRSGAHRRTDEATTQGGSGAGALEVTGWSSLPAGPEHAATQLVAPGEAGRWRAVPGQWPVTLDFAMNATDEGWSSVVLDGRGVPADELPSVVEILTNTSLRARGWRSVISLQPVYENGVARISFAPQRARHIRLSLSPAAQAGAAVSLRRVSVGR